MAHKNYTPAEKLEITRDFLEALEKFNVLENRFEVMEGICFLEWTCYLKMRDYAKFQLEVYTKETTMKQPEKTI